MRKTVPKVRDRKARDVFKTKGTVFLIRTEAAAVNNVFIFYPSFGQQQRLYKRQKRPKYFKYVTLSRKIKQYCQ